MSAGRPPASVSTFETKSGGVLYFEDTGVENAPVNSRSGPPVLCLHGIGGGAYFFSGFAKRMVETHRVICVDLPGTGKSPSGVNPFTLDSMAADLGDFAREVIREPVILLGHSFGTILALKAWEAREAWPPGSIRAMIFVCGLPKARPNIHERLSARADDIRANGIAGWGPKVSPGVFSKKTMAEKPEVTSLFERLFEEQVPETYTRIIDVLLAADLNAVVPTVTVPCAAICGAEDSYAPPDAVHAFVASLAALPAPCPVTVIEGAGHMPFYEAPEKFAQAVTTALRK